MENSDKNSSQISERSVRIYTNTLEKFLEWQRKTNNEQIFTEQVIMDYLIYLSTKVNSSTLWSHFSMLKKTIGNKFKIQIGDYKKVHEFLRMKNEGYVRKQSRVLETEHLVEFMEEAPDDIHLLNKVILLFGVAGAMRRDELYKLKMSDVELLENIVFVSINETKKFTITEHLDIYNKYVALRPLGCDEDAFFLNYQKGKCTSEKVGLNRIGRVPSEVAKFLKLPNPKEFTGHSLRRSANCSQDSEDDPMQRWTNLRDYHKRKTEILGKTPIKVEKPNYPEDSNEVPFIDSILDSDLEDKIDIHVETFFESENDQNSILNDCKTSNTAKLANYKKERGEITHNTKKDSQNSVNSFRNFVVSNSSSNKVCVGQTEDHIDLFFKSLAATARTLSPLLFIEAKKKLFEVMSDIEQKNAQEQYSHLQT